MFKLYSLNKRITTVKAQKCGLYTQWSTGDEMLGVHFQPFKAKEDFLVGINGSWNAIPTMLKPLDENTYSVDIDNDGSNEIVSIKETGRGNPDKTSVTLSFEIEKHGRKIILAKENIEDTSVKYCNIYAFDLNGDGKLEILLKISLGYGVLVKAFEINHDKAKEIVNFYDGD
jgi:hypothetical protein